MQINDNHGKIVVIDDAISEGEVDVTIYSGEDMIVYCLTKENAELLVNHIKDVFKI